MVSSWTPVVKKSVSARRPRSHKSYLLEFENQNVKKLTLYKLKSKTVHL